MLDDLNELRTFERILALGSLSAAARDLGVGLAVVSKRLATLERRVAQRLVHRTTRRLSPTEDGLALLGHVERLLDELAAAEARIASGSDAPRGVLRVSAPISFGRVHLVPVAAALIEQHPQLDIELRLDDRFVDMTEARIDVAVRIGAPRDSSAILHKLIDNYRILVASPAYLVRHGHPATPDALAGHSFLRYADGDAPWRIEAPDGAIAEVDARCRLRADSGDAVHDWALAGRGIMFRSRVDVAPELAAGSLIRVLSGWQSAPAPVYALLPSARQVATKSRIFIAALRDRLLSVC